MLVFLLFSSVLVLKTSADVIPRCPAGTVPPQNGVENVCYSFVSTPKSFSDAENYCKQQNGHLATVNDAFTDIYLTEKAHEQMANAESFWIGGRSEGYQQQSTVWTWTKCDGIVRYTNWKEEPASGTAPVPGYCISVSAEDGTWNVENCTVTRPFVCEVPGVLTMCDPGYSLFVQTNMCYKLVFDPANMRTFDEAEANCTSDGGHLASVHSAVENTFLSLMAPKKQDSYMLAIWIGATAYSGSATNFVWTDKTPYTYNNWCSLQAPTDRRCSWFVGGGDSQGACQTQWSSVFACDHKFGSFICKKPLSQISIYSN